MDYIDCGNNASLQLSTCTINFWLKINSAVTGSVISKYGAWYLGLINGVFVLYDWDGAGWISSATDLNDNTWHMITFIRQAGVADGSSIYIDNVLISTFTYESDTHSANLIFGGTEEEVVFEDGDVTFEDGDVTFEDLPGGGFDGIIDNVMIFNKVLTDDDIAWFWNEGGGVEDLEEIDIARNTDDVTYDQTEYAKGNFDFSGQEFCGDGSIPRVTLRVSKLQNQLEQIINATQGALGGQVKLLKVNNNYLNEPVPALEADYDVLCAASDEKTVTFTLGIPNPMTQQFPLRNTSSSMCPWATPTLFKGPECQYAGEDTTCPGDYLHCLEVKENAEHWGGEKGLDPNAV